MGESEAEYAQSERTYDPNEPGTQPTPETQTVERVLYVQALLTPNKKLWAIPLGEVIGGELNWWLIESQTEPGKQYLVDPNWCGCKGYGYRRTCTHVEELNALLEEMYGPDPDQDADRSGDQGNGDVQGGLSGSPQHVHHQGQASHSFPE